VSSACAEGIRGLVHRWDAHARLLECCVLSPGPPPVVKIALRSQGRTLSWVVHQYGPADLAHNPHVASMEHQVLDWVGHAGIPVPKPIWHDDDGFGDVGPFIVTQALKGSPILRRADLTDGIIENMAGILARLHQLDFTSEALPLVPPAHEMLHHLTDHTAEVPHADALRRIVAGRPPASSDPPVLLHGDFWPGNVLFVNQTFSALIDWEDAMIGDPAVDLANARLELLLFFGDDAAAQFTAEYRRLRPHSRLAALPFWEAAAALRFSANASGFRLDRATWQRFDARLADFVAHALHQL
jgi:aminoglycoside phosphotransferase (APT) family kinase protein